MSTDTIEPAADAVHGDEPTETGGSPSVVESHEEESVEGQGAGAEPAEQGASTSDKPESGAPGAPDSAEELALLRQQIAERDSLLTEIADKMERDPELAKRLGRGDGTGSQTSEAFSQFKSALTDKDNGLTPASAEVLERAMEPVFERMRQMEAALGRIDPTVRELNRTVGGDQFERALQANGIPPEVRNSPQFTKHLRAMETDRYFAQDKRSRQEYAGRVAAQAWLAKNGRVNVNRDERARLDSVRGQRNGNAPMRGSSIADKVTEITRSSNGSHIDEAARLRFEAMKQNKPLPNIRYVDRK